MLRAAVSRAVQLLSTTYGPQPIRSIEPKFTKLFINNEWTNSSRNTTISTFNPANGRLIAEVEEADWRDVDRAVKAANDALQPGSPWLRADGTQRRKLLHKLADLMERDKTILASLESLDNGKPFTTAYEFDLTLSIDCLRYYADLAAEMHEHERKPVGVCGHIIPWTAPLIIQTWAVAPTLAAGDTVVIKLPARTPLSGLHVASLIQEADFPAGVVNVVVGYDATTGRALCSHKGIKKFEAAATGTKCRSAKRRPQLESNERYPNIVFADANLDDAIQQTHYGMFFKDGHCYSAGSRTFVEGKIYDEFVDRSKEHAERRIIGDPFEPSTEQGPQIDGYQVKKILRHVERGKREGAHLVTGGQKWGDRGHYVLPTVLAKIDENSTLAREEVIGPVMKVIRFETIEDLLEKTRIKYNLLPTVVMSRDVEKANHLAKKLRSGAIWANCNSQSGTRTPHNSYNSEGIGGTLYMTGSTLFTNETRTRSQSQSMKSIKI